MDEEGKATATTVLWGITTEEGVGRDWSWIRGESEFGSCNAAMRMEWSVGKVVRVEDGRRRSMGKRKE